MQTRIIIMLMWIVLVTTSGCQPNDAYLERMPGIDLPIQDMNTDLHLIILENANTFQMGLPIWLLLYNPTDLPVVLNEEFGITVYKKMDENWENITDPSLNGPGNRWILANGDETHFSESLSISTDSVDYFSNKSVQFRIVIIGNFVKGSGKIGKEVGAYIDVTLNPK